MAANTCTPFPTVPPKPASPYIFLLDAAANGNYHLTFHGKLWWLGVITIIRHASSLAALCVFTLWSTSEARNLWGALCAFIAPPAQGARCYSHHRPKVHTATATTSPDASAATVT